MEQALEKAIRASLCTVSPSGSFDLRIRMMVEVGRAISLGTGVIASSADRFTAELIAQRQGRGEGGE
eukprot:scaffold55000_cov35-Tisochrysis_lutea.AAC.3